MSTANRYDENGKLLRTNHGDGRWAARAPMKKRAPARKAFTGQILLSPQTPQSPFADPTQARNIAVVNPAAMQLSRICYGYTRVSSLMQDLDCQAQKHFIEQRYKAQFEHDGYAWGGWFIDPAVSSTMPFLQRPGGAETTKRLKRGDVLIIDKWDRAFRSIIDFGVTIQVWKQTGIQVIALDMGMDATTPSGSVMAGMLALFAEFERRRISDRIRESHQAARARGEFWNRHRPWGFKLNVRYNQKLQKKERLITPWPEERKLMQEALAAREQGMTFPEIAQMFTAQGHINPNTKKPFDRFAVRGMIHSEITLQLTAAAAIEGRPIYETRTKVVGNEFLVTGLDVTGHRRLT